MHIFFDKPILFFKIGEKRCEQRQNPHKTIRKCIFGSSTDQKFIIRSFTIMAKKNDHTQKTILIPGTYEQNIS